METKKTDNKPIFKTFESKLNNSNPTLEDRWSRIENDYRRQYPSITDSDVNYRTGEFDDMLHRIARRTNPIRKVIENDILNWKQDKEPT